MMKKLILYFNNKESYMLFVVNGEVKVFIVRVNECIEKVSLG